MNIYQRRTLKATYFKYRARFEKIYGADKAKFKMKQAIMLGSLNPKLELVREECEASLFDPIAVKKRFKGAQRLKNDIFKRDNWLCQIKGAGCMVDRGLRVHHKIPIKKNVALAFDESNLILACKSCIAKSMNLQKIYENK